MAAIMAAIMEITENIMRRMREPSTKLHNALYFMSGMMVVILALVIVAGVKTKAENAGFHIAEDTENSYEQQVAGQTDTTQDSGQEKWQEGVVAYQGKEYLYNTDIKTYLMMGVDINGPVQQSSDYTQGGQSDALFLLVVNNTILVIFFTFILLCCWMQLGVLQWFYDLNNWISILVNVCSCYLFRLRC